MGKAVFYHLTRSGPDEALLMLLPRALQQGWRVLVRGRDRAGLEALDRALWEGPREVFLPHGLEGGPQDGLQPVLLGQGAAGPGMAAVALVQGAGLMAGDEGLERVWVLFDGNDAAAVDHARGLWKEVGGAGLEAEYWSEDSGRWQMKQSRPARAPG